MEGTGLFRLAASLVVALLLASCGPGAGSVTGVVVAGPACPSASGASAPACSPEPLANLPLTIVRVSDSAVVGQPTTDATGSFSVQLDAGRYRVHGAGVSGLTAPAPVFFDVSAGSATSVKVLYDTGIR